MRKWKEEEEDGLEVEREKSRGEKIKEEWERGGERGLNGGRVGLEREKAV
jgi:hypothetical protein